VKTTKIIFLGICCLSTLNAYAQNSKNKVNFFSIGAEGSYNWIDSSTLSVPANFTATNQKKNAVGYRLFWGYTLDESLAFEVGYLGTGNFKQTNIYLGSTAVNVARKVNGAELTALYKLGQSAPGVFFKIGLTYATVHGRADTSISGVNLADDQSGIGYLFGLGYEANIIENMDWRISYMRYLRLGGDSDNQMNNFALGVKYNF
jgi:opacity protein-like surface antigen